MHANPELGRLFNDEAIHFPFMPNGSEVESRNALLDLTGSDSSTYLGNRHSNIGSNAEFQLVVEQLRNVSHQVREILSFSRLQTFASTLPTDLPVALPIKTAEELELVETFLINPEHRIALVVHLSTLGGKNLNSVTNNVMKRCLTDQLASLFNFCGKGSKRPFNTLHLREVVVCAVKKNDALYTERKIEDCIKVWLKHSPQRLKMERLKRNKSTAEAV